uniref:Uncharacterized protein n=1 Tax=viral metagenome TaxID=1070528 RepID=A0A6M3IKS8_9ZZZZ
MATREELIEVREAFAAIFKMPVIKDDTPDAEIEAKIREAVPGLEVTDELAEDIQAILIGMDITDFLGRTIPDAPVDATPEEQATVVPPNRAAIIAAAKDLNANMDGLDPKIQTVAVKTDVLVGSVKAAGALVQAGDKISADTRATLKALGVAVPEPVVKGKRGKKVAGEKPAKVKKERMPRQPKVPGEKSQYGVVSGSKTAMALEMLSGGTHSMADVKAEFGATFYEALKKVQSLGFKVVKDESGKYSITK